MSSIRVCVPTRGRPANALRLRQAVNVTSMGDTRVVFGVDDDDPQLGGYQAALGLTAKVGPRLRMGPTLNVMAMVAVGEGIDVVGFMGDDHLPLTRGWDDRVRSALDSMGGSGVVYCNDLVQGPNLPTEVFISSDIVAALGYFCPPRQIHLYLDNFWLKLGTDLDRLRYLPNVIIEHLHPLVGTAPSDAGYEEVNAPSMYAHDKRAYEDYLVEDYDAALGRARAVLASA